MDGGKTGESALACNEISPFSNEFHSYIGRTCVHGADKTALFVGTVKSWMSHQHVSMLILLADQSRHRAADTAKQNARIRGRIARISRLHFELFVVHECLHKV